MNLLGEQRDVTPAIYEDVCRRRLGVAPRARVDAGQRGAGGGARQGPARRCLRSYAMTKEGLAGRASARIAGYPGRVLASGAATASGCATNGSALARSTARCSCMPAPDPLGTALDVDAIDSQVRQEIARMGLVRRTRGAAKLALPSFTLQGNARGRSPAKIRAVNARDGVASKESGEAPRPSAASTSSRESRQADMLSIAEWHVLNPNGPTRDPGLRPGPRPEATLREPIAKLFAKNDVSRIVVGSHAVGRAAHPHPAWWRCRADRQRQLVQRL